LDPSAISKVLSQESSRSKLKVTGPSASGVNPVIDRILRKDEKPYNEELKREIKNRSEKSGSRLTNAMVNSETSRMSNHLGLKKEQSQERKNATASNLINKALALNNKQFEP